MGSILVEGERPVRVELRISPRARRLTLRVSATDGRAWLTLPRGVPLREAESFVASRAEWLRRHLARVEPPRQVGPGCRLPVEGRPRLVKLAAAAPRSGDRRGVVRLDDDTLTVVGEAGQLGARLAAFLRETARARLSQQVARHARVLGRRPSRLVLRDTRSRWGSCSSEGRLMFSWRLIMAPPEVLDYVAAHEVAHLRHMDHSPAFWATVATLHEAHETARAWLRDEAPALLRWRFT